MTWRVRVLRRAVDDLVAIGDYIRRDAPERADDVVERLLTAIESLDRIPARAARPRDERLRKLGYRYLVSEPYLIFFKVATKRRLVRVHRVLHGKREYREIL